MEHRELSRSPWTVAPALALALSAGAAGGASAQDPAHQHAAPGAAPHAVEIPRSVREEHEDIQARLRRATEAAGDVGAAARELQRVLQPHFVREEQIALPPLGLLQRLARGERGPEMMAMVPLSDSLKAELPSMLAEHATIRAAVATLRARAAHGGHPEVVSLADDLAHHAMTEEEVTYPAAILVGELLRAGTHERMMR